MHIIEAKNIIKSYSNHIALNDVSISIPKGTIYGLMGPNGAGKSTLIRILNRITAPDSGELLFNGSIMKSSDVSKIGYLPEERGLYKKMKVGEQALYLSMLKGMSKEDAIRELRAWFQRLEITSWWDKKVEELSKGMAQKVQFITTVIHKPELLIFDEPFSGFDPINAQLLKDEILRLKDNGATVIFSTHNMSSVEEICDYVTLINSSKNVLTGRVDDIRREWGDNSYKISYGGDLSVADRELISTLSLNMTENVSSDSPIHDMTLRLKDPAASKELISIFNNSTQIQEIRRIDPSMNDIFISVVEHSRAKK